VDVEAEDPMTGIRELACSTYLTFVAFESGQPVKIAELVPETDDERKRWQEADARKAKRVERRKLRTKMDHQNSERAPSSGAGQSSARAAAAPLGPPPASSAALASRKSVSVPLLLRPADASNVALAPRCPRDSYVEIVEMVLPSHTNPMGTAFGGQMMFWIDACAAVIAQQHCRREVVTASIDDLHFHKPVQRGEIAIFRGQVNRAFKTSMEVGVRVEAEDPVHGVLSRRLCCSAYITMVAVDENGDRVAVPAIVAETADEKRRFEETLIRRNTRVGKSRARQSVVNESMYSSGSMRKMVPACKEMSSIVEAHESEARKYEDKVI
jgi:acyl-CoA hydrolase